MTKGKSQQGDQAARALAQDVLLWIVSDEDRVFPFLNATGLAPEDLRRGREDPVFLAGVLDHLMGDEAVLLACAQALDIPPERVASAWHHLAPPAEDFS